MYKRQIKETKLSFILYKRGIKQRDLKQMIDEKFPESPISLDTLSKFINGRKSNITISTIKRICIVLDVTPNDIIDFDEEDYNL